MGFKLIEFVCEERFYERQDLLCFQNLTPHLFDQPIWCIEEVLISYLCVLNQPLSFVPSKHIRSGFVGSFTSLVLSLKMRWCSLIPFPSSKFVGGKESLYSKTPPPPFFFKFWLYLPEKSFFIWLIGLFTTYLLHL